MAQFDGLLPDHQRAHRRPLGDGGLHSAGLVLAQTDFEQIERNQREGRWDLVGNLLAEQGNKLKAAIADLAQRGAQAVILGCTEFGILIEAKDSPVPLIDTTLAHAEAAADMALQQ